MPIKNIIRFVYEDKSLGATLKNKKKNTKYDKCAARNAQDGTEALLRRSEVQSNEATYTLTHSANCIPHNDRKRHFPRKKDRAKQTEKQYRLHSRVTDNSTTTPALIAHADESLLLQKKERKKKNSLGFSSIPLFILATQHQSLHLFYFLRLDPSPLWESILRLRRYRGSSRTMQQQSLVRMCCSLARSCLDVGSYKEGGGGDR